MLRAERPRSCTGLESGFSSLPSARQMLLAVAPSPPSSSTASAGWPDWLAPAFRSGGHRPALKVLEEER